MTQDDLSKLLNLLGVPVSSWKTEKNNENVFPRIVYWPFLNEDIVSSGETYTCKDTYQVSIYSKNPDDPVLKNLRSVLRENGLHPIIYREYVIEDNVFHFYFSIEVLSDENLEEMKEEMNE